MAVRIISKCKMPWHIISENDMSWSLSSSIFCVPSLELNPDLLAVIKALKWNGRMSIHPSCQVLPRGRETEETHNDDNGQIFTSIRIDYSEMESYSLPDFFDGRTLEIKWWFIIRTKEGVMVHTLCSRMTTLMPEAGISGAGMKNYIPQCMMYLLLPLKSKSMALCKTAVTPVLTHCLQFCTKPLT